MQWGSQLTQISLIDTVPEGQEQVQAFWYKLYPEEQSIQVLASVQ